jgi:hypothetical protein
MSKSDYDNRQQSGELHARATHSHLVAEQHGKQVQLGAHEQSRQAHEHVESNYHAAPETPSAHGVAPFGHAAIAALAYELWQARGCPEGSHEEDWFNAAHQLRARAEIAYRKT